MNPTDTPNAEDITVNQLGDVTERTVLSPVSGDMIPVQPISKLPKTHKHLAKVYPGAVGFTVEESGSVALHF